MRKNGSIYKVFNQNQKRQERERSTIKSYNHSKYYPKINKYFKCKWFKYIN